MVYSRLVPDYCKQADAQCRVEGCWLEQEVGKEAFVNRLEEVADYI